MLRRFLFPATPLTTLIDAAILRILLKNETLGDDVDIAQLAKDTDTYSGSDLKRELRPRLFPFSYADHEKT